MGLYTDGNPRFFFFEIIGELISNWKKKREYKNEMKRLKAEFEANKKKK